MKFKKLVFYHPETDELYIAEKNSLDTYIIITWSDIFRLNEGDLYSNFILLGEL